MSSQETTYVTRRPLGRPGLVLAAVFWLSLTAAPPARADDGGLLGDTAQVVGGTAEQALDPVLETVQPTAPQPLQEAVEPAVPQIVEPVTTQVDQTVEAVVRDAEQTVKATVRVAEQAVEPVVRVAEPTSRQAEEPAVKAVDPAAGSARTPAPPAPGIAATTTAGGADGVSVPGAAQPVPAGTQDRGDERLPPGAEDRPAIADLAPRAMGASAVLHVPHGGDAVRDGDDPRPDQRLWTLTNRLMHLWAAPNGVDAGLPGDGGGSSRAPGIFDPIPMLLGLLLGFLSLVLARRGVARPSRQG